MLQKVLIGALVIGGLFLAYVLVFKKSVYGGGIKKTAQGTPVWGATGAPAIVTLKGTRYWTNPDGTKAGETETLHGVSHFQ